MRSTIFKTFFAFLVLAVSISLSSFTRPGGDVFEIYIGKDLVLQQALYGERNIKEITIRPDQRGEKMSVRFYHCGKVGTKRVITFKDVNDKTLRSMNFAEGKTDNSIMSFPLSMIPEIDATSDTRLRVYYSSAEMPEGKWLCSIAR